MISKQDRQWYFVAKNLAAFGEHRVRVGSIATVAGKLLSGAFNTERNDAKNVAHMEATRHAEWNTLKMLPVEKAPKATIYVARLNLQGEEMPSRPCDYCRITLENYSVKQIVFFDGDKLVKERV